MDELLRGRSRGAREAVDRIRRHRGVRRRLTVAHAARRWRRRHQRHHVAGRRWLTVERLHVRHHRRRRIVHRYRHPRCQGRQVMLHRRRRWRRRHCVWSAGLGVSGLHHIGRVGPVAVRRRSGRRNRWPMATRRRRGRRIGQRRWLLLLRVGRYRR